MPPISRLQHALPAFARSKSPAMASALRGRFFWPIPVDGMRRLRLYSADQYRAMIPERA